MAKKRESVSRGGGGAFISLFKEIQINMIDYI